jgi:hypothetical protein
LGTVIRKDGDYIVKKLLTLVAYLFLNDASDVLAQGAPNKDTIIAMGAYVPTDDMKVSENFYRILFNRDPVIQLDNFIAFDIAGGWFAIVSRTKYAPASKPGTGSVPTSID